MKKTTVEEDPLNCEFDFTNARRNPYFLAYHGPHVVRVPEPDLAKIFPDNAAVNAALRTIANAAEQTRKTRISARRAFAPNTMQRKS